MISNILILIMSINGITVNQLPVEQRVQIIYDKLWDASGRSEFKPKLIVINERDINAVARNESITIYSGLLKYARNDSELAMVIGHEIAHISLGHLNKWPTYPVSQVRVGLSSDDINQYQEVQADRMGLFYAIKAGYNICEGREIWRRMSVDFPRADAGSHPFAIDRYKDLNINCE